MIPINQVKSTTDYDTLITGTCPACGQTRLNNRDNIFCGGCGKKLTWPEEYKKTGGEGANNAL